MATTTQAITAEDLYNMPDHGGRNELVKGELREMSPPTFRHGEIMCNFSLPLGQYVRVRKLGRISIGDPGFILARKPDMVLAPDIAFIKTSRIAEMEKPVGYWDGAPDLVVEVISPSDTVYGVEEKVADWLDKGCSMVVVVSDKKRTVTVHRPNQSPRILRGDEVFDGDDVVPGFSLPLRDIFA